MIIRMTAQIPDFVWLEGRRYRLAGVSGRGGGFLWNDGSPNKWLFRDNVAHNNRVNGIFTWQNTADPRHLIGESVMYHNGFSGIEHGAYVNLYQYRGLTLHGNGTTGF
jgi:hypothetical protein